MPVKEEILKQYTPRNKFSYTWTQNKEMYVTGKVSTYMGDVHGSTSSYHTIESYTVTVTYDGPVDIGDRKLREQKIPNYWRNKEVLEQAERVFPEFCVNNF